MNSLGDGTGAGVAAMDPFDGDKTWSRYLPFLWSPDPDPGLPSGWMPPFPPRDDVEAQRAWWTPLVHLTRFGMGLRHPGHDLWQLLNGELLVEPMTQTCLNFIDAWWGAHLEEFMAWGTSGGDQRIERGFDWPLADETTFKPRHLVQPAPLWSRMKWPDWQEVWGAGHDPLLLGRHCEQPLSGAGTCQLSEKDDHVVLTALTYSGWYRALLDMRASSPASGRLVLVRIENFGDLGIFQVRPGQLPRLEHRAFTNPPYVLKRVIELLREEVSDQFLFACPSPHWVGGVYTQGMLDFDRTIYVEVPSNQFLDPPLSPYQVSQLLEMGWQPPDDERPNFWRIFAASTPAGDVSRVLVRTLAEVYSLSGGEYTLAPGALASVVLPDSIDITLDSGDEDEGQQVKKYEAWLREVEGGLKPTPLSVALSVARCPEVDAAREQQGHPCRRIVSLQSPAASEWQVPEAWAGNLITGKIAFISSNPSISEAGDSQSGDVAEEYPRADWSDEDIADFVLHRFDSDRTWATPQGHFLRQDGTLSPTPVNFWAGVRNRASEIYGRRADPANDYVMTEVVHCKSKRETGVAEAATNCVDRHLDSILALSPAPLVLILGKKARELLMPRWDLGPEFGTAATVGKDELANLVVRNVGGRDRVVAFLWHPSGSKAQRTFATAYPTQLSRLQGLVSGQIAPEAFKSGEMES